MISLSVIKSPLATYYLHILLIILLLKRKCFISEVDKMFPDGQGPKQRRMEKNLQPYPPILVTFKFPQQVFQEQDNAGVQKGHQQYFLLSTVPFFSVRKQIQVQSITHCSNEQRYIFFCAFYFQLPKS